MPKPVVPHRSGPHRQAAIALYRALLSQCRALPLASSSSATIAQTQRDELQNIVRHRFKQSRFSQSKHHLRVSFDAGYEALDHLDASVAGDEASSEYISALLQRAPERLKLPPAIKQSPVKTAKEVRPPQSEAQKPSIFDRPYPLSSLSGRRRVPILVNANGIPMLRITKPQPPSLSGYISHRIHKRQVRFDRSNQLEEDRKLAAREDEWDDLVSASELTIHKQGTAYGKDMEPEWVDAVQDALEGVRKSLRAEKRKNQITAERMQAVVDREQALYDQEKKERKSKLQRASQKRRRERRRVQSSEEAFDTK